MSKFRKKLPGIAFLAFGLFLYSSPVTNVYIPLKQPWEHTLYLPVVMRLPLTHCGNHSTTTTCAEVDNVNIPIYSRSQISQYRITATHPAYEYSVSDCTADPCEGALRRLGSDTCVTLADDGVTVLKGCRVSGWWRPYQASVIVQNRAIGEFSYIVLNRKIPGKNSWPEFFVLYEDGYLRLKPFPKEGFNDVCFGASVIVGPAEISNRPYVDIQKITVSLSLMQLTIEYRDGKGTAVILLEVDRSEANAVLQVNYPINPERPFATYRSMFVENGNADVDTILSPEGEYPVIGEWGSMIGPWWKFFRKYPSSHNNSAPDLRIEIAQ